MFDTLFFVGSLVTAFVAGVLCNSQTLRDKINGVPAEVRAAIKGLETRTVATVAATKTQAVASAVKAITPTMPTPPANPVPKAPADEHGPDIPAQAPLVPTAVV